MEHDDINIPYLATMIDHGRHIPRLQRGGSLRGRPHKTYNKRIVSNSAAGSPRYTIEHDQYTVNDVSSLGISAHPSNHRAAAQAVPIITLLHGRRDRHSSCATLPWVHTPPVAGYTEHDPCEQPTSAGSSHYCPVHTQDMPQPGAHREHRLATGQPQGRSSSQLA